MADLPGRWELLAPPGSGWPGLQRVHLRQRGWPGLHSHLWEQSVVAAAASSGARVLNIAGSGPWFGGPQVSWLHDAAVFDHPEAYRASFVLWYRALFRQRARRGDLLVTPSAHARARLAHHLGVAESRIAVLPHGGDHLDAVAPEPAVLGRLGLERSRFWLCIASHNPNKNLPRLLRAHARGRAGRWPLVLVGDTHDRVFANAGLKPGEADIVALPQASDAELKALLQAARALVMPSLSEGFGLPALEAMRLGCAVLAARAGALPELCGEAAHFVDPLSDDDIASALDTLARDDVRIDELRRAGLQQSAPLTWARAARSLLDLLAQPTPGAGA